MRDPHYANVTMLLQPAAKFEIPTRASVVWTSQNFHDYLCKFMGPVDMQRGKGVTSHAAFLLRGRPPLRPFAGALWRFAADVD